jgi:titin
VVQGNYIGTDSSGTHAVPNDHYDGISVAGNASATIGGTGPGEGNVVSGNNGRGIAFGPGTMAGTVLEGNFIGTDPTGTVAVPNQQEGVYFNGGSGITVGVPGSGNVISGNSGDGLAMSGTGIGSFTIQGNFIGTTASGTGALGNGGFGVAFQDKLGNDLLGGTAAGAANTIAFNGKAGVQIGLGSGHRISRNSIFRNGGLGIDLTACVNGACPGPNLNDIGDGDGGPNMNQNFPVITSSPTAAGSTTIKGSLNSQARTSYTVELYSSPTCNPSGYGEGQHFLGAAVVTTNRAGNVNFSVVLSPAVPAGSAITATAADAAGNTSEFSPCRGPLTVTPTKAVAGTTVKLSGKHFGASQTLTLLWNCPVASCSTGTVVIGTVVTNSRGTFSGQQVTIPASAAAGGYWIGARTAAIFATTPFTVS